MPGSISPSPTLESGQIPGMPTNPIRTELEQKRDDDIVRAAIEAASKQHPQISQKRSLSTFCNDVDQTSVPTVPGAKKKPTNAFSKMMKGGTAKEEYQPGFEQWFQYIEKALAEKEAGLSHYPSDSEWASLEWANAVTDTIIESVKRKIQWSLYRASFFRAKINALHALIEIASGVAYAPKSKASDSSEMAAFPNS